MGAWQLTLLPPLMPMQFQTYSVLVLVLLANVPDVQVSAVVLQTPLAGGMGTSQLAVLPLLLPVQVQI